MRHEPVRSETLLPSCQHGSVAVCLLTLSRSTLLDGVFQISTECTGNIPRAVETGYDLVNAPKMSGTFFLLTFSELCLSKQSYSLSFTTYKTEIISDSSCVVESVIRLTDNFSVLHRLIVGP